MHGSPTLLVDGVHPLRRAGPGTKPVMCLDPGPGRAYGGGTAGRSTCSRYCRQAIVGGFGFFFFLYFFNTLDHRRIGLARLGCR